MDWKYYSFIIRSTYREKILFHLTKMNATPMELAQRYDFEKAQVSRTLKELEKEGFIICLTPELKKGRIFTVTEEGKKLVKEIESYRNSGEQKLIDYLSKEKVKIDKK